MTAILTPAAQPSRTTNILYWISTSLVALMMLEGGIVEIMRTDSSMQVMTALGYPAYFSVMLGVAKLLGVAAIVLPVPRTLREWAYAGFTFDVLAATVSLATVGPVNGTLSIPIISLALVQASYWTWRRRSALGATVAQVHSSPESTFAGASA